MASLTRARKGNITRTKKFIACAVSAALVASLGYVHLWAPNHAIAEGDTVEISFDLSDDIEVTANGLTFDSQSTDSVSVSADQDFTFEVQVTHDDRMVGSISASFPQVTEETDVVVENGQEAGEESSPEGEATENEAEPSSAAVPTNGVVVLQQETEPIAETAAILQAKDQAASDEDQAEVVEDDATPMAAAPSTETETKPAEAEISVSYDPETKRATINQEDLAKAVEANQSIIVSIASDSVGTSVKTWEEIVDTLAQEGEAKIKLSDDIKAESPVTVNGEKTLDLNGHTIKSSLQRQEKNSVPSLFTVKSGACFTLDDSASKYLDTVEEVKELPKPTEPNEESSEKPNTDLVGNLLDNESDINKGEFATDWTGHKATIENNELTYYVTRSYIGNEVGTTDEYQIVHTIDMSRVGTVEAQNEQNVITSESGAKIVIAGGRVNLVSGVQGDSHGVVMTGGDEFTMEGGFITNFYTTGLGAALSVNAKTESSKVNIGGNAVIAGNTAFKNGGAIWASAENNNERVNLTVDGNAVIAGNVAGTEKSSQLENSIATTKNGGGIYARKNVDVTLTGSAVVSGNTALADGGGVYIEGRANDDQTKNTLCIEDNASITNNRAENDRMAVHPKDRSAENHEALNNDTYWQNYGGGGGGVFTLDETTIKGGQITANYASDGGGGVFAVGGLNVRKEKWGGGSYDPVTLAFPLLKMENGIIASNYAGTSEGGGLNVSTNRESYIKAGYITNNMTATYYDYGGGGLFLSSATQGKETGMTLYAPLIKSNTAAGLGGGVASCTNGIVVSANAAVYDNTALAKNTTQNPNEYGDQWLLEGALYGGELKNVDTYGLEGEGIENYADDFYCAKKSTILNQMLGGGFYNWEGYTTGTVEVEQSFYAERKGYLNAFMEINGGKEIKITNAMYRSENNTLTLIVPSDQKETVLDLKGYYIYFKSIDVSSTLSPKPKAEGSGIIDFVDPDNPNHDTPSSPNASEVILTLYLNLDAKRPSAKKTDITLTQAYTRTETDPTDYPMYKVEELGDTKTYIKSDRLAALKANPTPESKEEAEKCAKLFFTGNYSNTHGGAIACNDYVDVGGAEIPESSTSEKETGALKVTKTLNKFDGDNGSATAVFEVTGYADFEAYKAQLASKVVYSNTIGFTFDSSEEAKTQDRLLENLPVGYYVVRELFYSGDNFRENVGRNIKTVAVTSAATIENPVEVSFTNTYKDESYGTGVVNSYLKGESGYTYIQDANYGARKEALETEPATEGGE